MVFSNRHPIVQEVTSDPSLSVEEKIRYLDNIINEAIKVGDEVLDDRLTAAIEARKKLLSLASRQD